MRKIHYNQETMYHVFDLVAESVAIRQGRSVYEPIRATALLEELDSYNSSLAQYEAGQLRTFHNDITDSTEVIQGACRMEREARQNLTRRLEDSLVPIARAKARQLSGMFPPVTAQELVQYQLSV